MYDVCLDSHAQYYLQEVAAWSGREARWASDTLKGPSSWNAKVSGGRVEAEVKREATQRVEENEREVSYLPYTAWDMRCILMTSAFEWLRSISGYEVRCKH